MGVTSDDAVHHFRDFHYNHGWLVTLHRSCSLALRSLSHVVHLITGFIYR